MNKLYQLLRLKDASMLEDLDEKMSVISGKKGVLEKIEEENDWHVKGTLQRFGVKGEDPTSREVYGALLAHLRKTEERLRLFLNGGDGREFNNFEELLVRGQELMKPKKLWVLKKGRFKEILLENPPPTILKIFGYKNGEELFENEKLEEVASSLRFMETNDWMHKTFDGAYSSLTPDDFEEREAEAIKLSGKWLEAGRKFVEKKRHNLSHLKELGLIFIIPISINQYGELLRVFALYLHYLYEVQFYSDLFRNISKEGDFSQKLISLLRGDVLDNAPQSEGEGSMNWLIVQRYLAKDYEWERRLFVPHVNPEAVHWARAEEALAKLDERDLSLTFRFWVDLDWVGGYFNGGKRELISFDLIDTVMSLVKERDMLKYMYHQQEALWNRIFEGYMGDGEKIEELIKKNLLKGYISLP